MRSMTVPAVSRASRRHFRQQRTPGRVEVTIGLAGRPAVGADEAVTPSCALKVGRARSFVREQALELRQRARERQIVPLKYVNAHDRSMFMQALNTLPVVGGCDNRISTERTTRWNHCVGMLGFVPHPNLRVTALNCVAWG